LHNHGARYQDILKYLKEDVKLGDKIGDSSTIKAEIIHAVREEMAVRLSDVIFRRTELGTGEYPPKRTIQICAEIMGAELKWHEDKKKHEIDDLEKNLFLKFR
jgi:glycerol-3-phosphate dehydrogenase